MNSKTSGLDIQRLAIKLPTFSLNAHFSLAPGERLGLSGRSGIGKTTLFRVIAGLRRLEKGESGKIYLQDQDMTSRPPHKRMMGYLFQNPPLLEHLNVLENVALGLRLRGVERRQREEASRAWLRQVHLEDRALSPIEVLSGGEKQRVAFAQALITRPRLLLLDEPFSALDNDLRLELRALLLNLVTEANVLAILVSHHSDDLAFFATKILSVQERDDGRTRVVEE